MSQFVPPSVRYGNRRVRFAWWVGTQREALALRLAPWLRGTAEARQCDPALHCDGRCNCFVPTGEAAMRLQTLESGIASEGGPANPRDLVAAAPGSKSRKKPPCGDCASLTRKDLSEALHRALTDLATAEGEAERLRRYIDSIPYSDEWEAAQREFKWAIAFIEDRGLLDDYDRSLVERARAEGRG